MNKNILKFYSFLLAYLKIKIIFYIYKILFPNFKDFERKRERKKFLNVTIVKLSKWFKDEFLY